MMFHDNSTGHFTTDAEGHNWTNSYDEWHHVAMTADGTNFFIYLDGQLVDRRTINTGSYLTGELFSGNIVGVYVCDMRIYDTCLTKHQVKELSKACVLNLDFSDSYIEGTTNLVT